MTDLKPPFSLYEGVPAIKLRSPVVVSAIEKFLKARDIPFRTKITRKFAGKAQKHRPNHAEYVISLIDRGSEA